MVQDRKELLAYCQQKVRAMNLLKCDEARHLGWMIVSGDKNTDFVKRIAYEYWFWSWMQNQWSELRDKVRNETYLKDANDAILMFESHGALYHEMAKPYIDEHMSRLVIEPPPPSRVKVDDKPFGIVEREKLVAKMEEGTVKIALERVMLLPRFIEKITPNILVPCMLHRIAFGADCAERLTMGLRVGPQIIINEGKRLSAEAFGDPGARVVDYENKMVPLYPGLSCELTIENISNSTVELSAWLSVIPIGGGSSQRVMVAGSSSCPR